MASLALRAKHIKPRENPIVGICAEDFCFGDFEIKRFGNKVNRDRCFLMRLDAIFMRPIAILDAFLLTAATATDIVLS